MRELIISDNECVEVGEDAIISISDNAKPLILIKPQQDVKIELKIGKNCQVKSFVIQEKDASVTQTNHIGEWSTVYSHGFWLSAGTGQIINSLEGSNSEAHDLHVFVEKNSNKLHLDAVLRHANHDTKGSILVKGIVKDNASAKLDGMIKIEKNGNGASSFLSEHVMLLNPGAHATANPELEIENNDVSSRHAASVSQIDEEKIFYLVSRGINREDARKLIVDGFLTSAIEKTAVEELKKELLEKTLSSI